MSQIDKLIDKFMCAQADFTFAELTRLLNHLGYIAGNSGKTSGSAVRFINANGAIISLHRPHPDTKLKAYAIRGVRETLIKRGEL